MTDPRPQALPRSLPLVKKALTDAGLEIFRTRGDEIVLAERPRENLILDSGVRLALLSTTAGETFEVRVVLRAQKADFPNDDDAALFSRVRQLAAPVEANGFAESSTVVSRVQDPGDAQRTLDLFYEIVFSKAEAGLETAVESLRFALGVEKRAQSTIGLPT